VRETRRFCGIEKVTVDQALAGYKPENTIALAGYKIDIHSGKWEGTLLQEVVEPYGIPLGSLISADLDGLLFSGRCISVDHETLGSMRVMPTCMAIGQGAGTLAACAARQGISPKDVNYREVVGILLKDKAILR